VPKLSCQEAQVLLEAFHDNELDSVNSLSVQEHLNDCPDCRRHWRWLCEVEASLQRLNETVPSPSPDLRLRVMRDPVKQSSPVVAFFRARRRFHCVVGKDWSRRDAVCPGFGGDGAECCPA
jgi:predicted anti-sigma-YlaC factor YlaD